jgi:hypothetical protein
MLTLETIKKDSIWVVKMNWGRLSGTYEEMRPYIEADDEDNYCRDHDLCCEQPDHLKEFYDGYWEYDRKHGFTTIQDYYNNVYSKKKRDWSKEDIKNLLLSNDKAVMRGIVAIYNFQTECEQDSDETQDANGVGFNGVDAPFLSSLAKQILSKGHLSSKQMECGRKRIIKYAGQLLTIANN